MAIPNSPNWSALIDALNYQPTGIAKPPNLAFDVVQAVSLGPMQLNNSGGKLNERYWIAYVDNGAVYIKGSQGERWGAEALLLNELEPIKQITLTFDQLGRPLVFYRVGADTLKLYWYNPVLEQTELKVLAQGISPNAGFDAPQDTGQSYSDAMLFYVRDDIIYMRVQRDRFETEYVTPTGQEANSSIDIVYKEHTPDSIGTSLSTNLPEPISDGDTVIATIMHRDTLTLPQGWEFLGVTDPVVNSSYRQAVTQAVIKVTQSDIGSTHTFTQATSQRMVLSIIAARSDSEITPEFIGKLLYSPQTPAPLPNISASYNGATIIAAASFVYALTNGKQTVTVSSPYLLETQSTRVFNRLGVASAKVTDAGIQGATMIHENENISDGASMATALIASSGPVSTAKNLNIMSSGMRVDNRYQVVYRYEDDTYTPPPPVPPVPPALNGDYIYMQASTTQFGLEKPLITSAQHDDISITFNIYGANKLLSTLNPTWGAYGIPIFCEGGTTTLYPIPLWYNKSIFFDILSPQYSYFRNSVRDAQLKASRKFSLAFMYSDNALYLTLVINGKKYAPIMPFNLSDGRWTVAITGNTLTVLNDATTLFTMEIDRGQDGDSEPEPGRFGAYSLGPLHDMWRQNFRGALYGITVNIAGAETNYPLMTQNSLTQESYPPGNNITIYNHKPANWKYIAG
ncbi:hypothetical protein EI165_00305 [Pseudoalteromonas nigrifaciens]|uniref:hypothetical protein n=1 Tax=Pseudoalteromonas nigrifaciens TaxID=28109 RepID=UPI0017881637|nr:hypothetical protein [Pseudoalteromonas nigrifaciens]MBE0418561.1 hypothetical protein [Pseudoalteromonas nigrifaciens]